MRQGACVSKPVSQPDEAGVAEIDLSKVQELHDSVVWDQVSQWVEAGRAHTILVQTFVVAQV